MLIFDLKLERIELLQKDRGNGIVVINREEYREYEKVLTCFSTDQMLTVLYMFEKDEKNTF